MSEDHHQPIENENDDSGFYNDKKSQESDSKRDNNDDQNIPSKSDAFKHGKYKRIKKRQHGHRKHKTSKEQERQRRKLQEAQNNADQIIDEMQKRYKQDEKLYEKKKPANKKLIYLKELAQKLTNIRTWDKFLQMDGLRQFDLWFTKLPEGIEPSLTLRKGLLQILNRLKIKSEYISKTSQIQRVVQKHKKSQTKQLRQLSESILLKWSKTIHEEENE